MGLEEVAVGVAPPPRMDRAVLAGEAGEDRAVDGQEEAFSPPAPVVGAAATRTT